MRSYRDNLDTPIGTALSDRPLPPIPPAHLRSRCCGGGGGGGADGNGAGLSRMVRSKKKKKPLGQWPPAEYALPDTIEGIEAGRAERRLGEMLKETPKATGAAGRGKKGAKRGTLLEPRIKSPTLASLNIDKKLSARSQKLAGLSETIFENKVSTWRDRVVTGGENTKERS